MILTRIHAFAVISAAFAGMIKGGERTKKRRQYPPIFKYRYLYL